MGNGYGLQSSFITIHLYTESGQLAQNIGPKEQILYLRNMSDLVSLWGEHELSLSFLEEAVELIRRENLPEEYPVINKNIFIGLCQKSNSKTSTII